MISYSEGNLHDIHHFMLVWSYAKTIGESEKSDTESRLKPEIAAILQDIACPPSPPKAGIPQSKSKILQIPSAKPRQVALYWKPSMAFHHLWAKNLLCKKMPLQKGEYPKK